MSNNKVLVRKLQPYDVLLPPHWHHGLLRPVEDTTLIALTNGVITGLMWSTYGGTIGLMVHWFSCDNNSGYPLLNATIQLAKDLSCATILTHVQFGSKIHKAINRRKDCYLNTWQSIALCKIVDAKLFELSWKPQQLTSQLSPCNTVMEGA